MHACPCCGYKTLPGRGDYDLCPVCWWEDEGLLPWEYSGPNAQTLIEAQQEYLAETRPYRRRPGKVRAPKRQEARDPDWRPSELTDEVLERVARANEEMQHWFEEEARQAAREIEEDPEGPFKEFNASLVSLRAKASTMSHRDIRAELGDLRRAHAAPLPDAVVELMARHMTDEDFYRHHPLHAAWWLLRYSRPGTFRRRWRELRTGSVTFAA
jgi:hypothetical protein